MLRYLNMLNWSKTLSQSDINTLLKSARSSSISHNNKEEGCLILVMTVLTKNLMWPLLLLYPHPLGILLDLPSHISTVDASVVINLISI